jgi:hypothetical protein
VEDRTLIHTWITECHEIQRKTKNRRLGDRMKKQLIVPLLSVLFITLVPAAMSATVTRYLPTSACAGSAFDVILSIDVAGESFYLIDEIAPTAAVVVNSGGGDSTTNPPHIFWSILSGAQDTNYTYTVQAPAQLGTISFSGTYGSEGGSETPILGDTDVQIVECQPESDLASRVAELEAWKANADSRITALEDWKVQAVALISELQAQLQQLISWLDYAPETIFCDVISSCGQSAATCSEVADCGTDGLLAARYCSAGDVYASYRTYTCNTPIGEDAFCSHTDTPTLIQECTELEQCQSGACVALTITCSSDEDCEPTAFEGESYCEEGDAYRLQRQYSCIEPGTPQSSCEDSLVPALIQDCDAETETCADGECRPIQGSEVLFRTNAVGNWADLKSTWIAFDVNDDGTLDGLGYKGKYVGCPPGGWGTDYVKLNYTTPAGTGATYDIYVKSGKVGICASQWGNFYEFRPGYNAYGATQVSSSPASPYAENGQEVYG